jgi:hypothetical protein
MNQRVIADPSQHGWVEVDGKWVWDAESGGAGAGMVISETEPTDKVEGMQWLNPTTGLVLFWDDEKWLQMPTTGAAGKDGADGKDAVWSEDANGANYTGNVTVNGQLVASDPGETAGINFTSQYGAAYFGCWANYPAVMYIQGGQLAPSFYHDTNNSVFNIPSAVTVTGDLLAAKADAGDNAVAIGRYAGAARQGADGIAIGRGAGNVDQNTLGTAIGCFAGYNNQGPNTVAVGYGCGQENQGAQSIAIGYAAGNTNQGTGGIIISAASGATDDSSAGHIIIKSSTHEMLSIPDGGFAMNRDPIIGAKRLISTLSTLRNATKDETTLEGMRDALADAIGGLIENLEHEIATQEISE